MKKNKSLAAYRARRNFTKTHEPKGRTQKTSKVPVFVIQKHAASHLHFDVRLEINKVLVSWAVPKGPSTDPRVKRLAVLTEPHPLQYARFEGVIPPGQYGAGTVMVWDRGTFKNIKMKDGKKVSLKNCFRNGQIEVELKGRRLRGGYVLLQFKKEKNQWLLKKIDDQCADKKMNVVTRYTTSAITGRTMQEIAQEAKAHQ